MPVMARMPRPLNPSTEWTITPATTVDELRVAEEVIVHGFPLTRVQPYEPGETLRMHYSLPVHAPARTG